MSKFSCNHCKLKFDESAMICDERGYKFCCNGCKNVFTLLNSSGLGEFYARLGKNTLSPVSNQNFSSAIFSKYIKKTPENFSEIHIIIEGIHCAACVWLNEKVLFNTPGILEADINATTNRTRIVWDESEISLKEILEKITLIGYTPLPYDPQIAQNHHEALRKELYAKLLVGIFGVMNIMWIAVAQYAGYFSGIDKDVKSVLSFGEFTLATLVLFYTGSAFFRGAVIALKTKNPNMDLLVISGAFLAYIYSIFAMLWRVGEVYFDSVAMIITFVFAGKYLEMISKKRASSWLDWLNLFMVGSVNVKNGDKIITKNPSEIQIGEMMVLSSGDKVLLDGVITNGSGNFDYSSLSGESLPVFKQSGDEILSGAILLDNAVEYRATREFSQSIFSKIIALLQNAGSKKPKIQNLADTISPKFSSFILLAALATFLFWLFYANSTETALIISISVIIVSCPCALGLATPIATTLGLAAAFKKGIVFKEASLLEDLAKCEIIVFDKTGTLTNGNLNVVNAEISPKFDLNLLYSLLISSNHIISQSVVKFLLLKYQNLAILQLSEIKNIPGKGMSAKFEDLNLLAGSVAFLNEFKISAKKCKFSELFFAINGEIMAKFELKDELKKGSAELIKFCKNLGLKTMMLSGDNEFVTQNVALNLGIDEFKSGCLPTQKAEIIGNLTKSHQVIMVGDGINDALALSLANVSVCAGNGADISIDKSDIVLINDDILGLKTAFEISHKTYKIIKQNLIFSLVYNVCLIPVAMCGLIIPLVAALSMSLSSLCVVLNSFRISSRGEK